MGYKRWFRRWLDFDAGAQGHEEGRQGWGIGMLNLQRLKDEPGWC
jgi:hypothetical protein